MLTAEQFDELADQILELYEKFETSVIEDIARRLARSSFDSATWQVQRLTESGSVYNNILDKLRELTGAQQKELNKIFMKAGLQTMKFDDAIYIKAGLNPIPLRQSPAMMSVLMAGLEKTNAIMRNLTLTTAISGQDSYINAADLAYMQVSTGAMSYTQAIKEAARGVAKNGLEVIGFTGRRDRVDVAMRRAVLTGVSQAAAQLQITRMDEMGTDLVETSAHIGARNTGTGPANHESWQGKVFSRSGTDQRYPPFVETTGYGTGEGLGGWNCRHSFFPFFDGISRQNYNPQEILAYANRKVMYNDKEISFYQATQEQRKIERAIREAKREEAAAKATGMGSKEETMKVKKLQAQMRSFINQTGLVRQNEREQIL